MPPTVREVIGNRGLVSVKADMTVREAIRLMVAGDYSQLPVLNGHGHVLGLFTERRLTQEVHQGTVSAIMDQPVRHFIDAPAKVVGPWRSIYDVASLLTETYAVVVIEDSQAIGIVTDYDIATFLVGWSRGISLVEDIEKRLRSYIEHILPTNEARDAAIYQVIGHDRRDKTKPAKPYDELTLYEYKQLIISDEYWPRFEPYLGPRDLLIGYIEIARPIRNQIAHFRGTLTPDQLAALRNVHSWLERRPPVPALAAVDPKGNTIGGEPQG